MRQHCCCCCCSSIPLFSIIHFNGWKSVCIDKKKKILNTRTLNENAKVRSLYWHQSKMPVALRSSMNFIAQSEFVAELWMRLYSIIKWVLQLKFARKKFKKNLLKSRFVDVICSFWMLEKSNTRAVTKHFSTETTHTHLHSQIHLEIKCWNPFAFQSNKSITSSNMYSKPQTKLKHYCRNVGYYLENLAARDDCSMLYYWSLIGFKWAENICIHPVFALMVIRN